MTLLSFILEQGLLVTFCLFGLGALLSLAAGVARNEKFANMAGHGFAILGSLAGVICGMTVLLTHHALSFSIPVAFPLLTSGLSVYIDGLAAFFITTISLVAVAASVYGVGYARQYYGKYSLASLGFFYNVFIASLLLVVVSNHALLFLFAWELMSLSSYFLVIFEHKHEENVKSGFLYFIMTHVATALLLAGFLLLYKYTGSFDFDVFRSHSTLLPLVVKNVVLVAALLGLGTKAGIVPLHIWLPEAHPSAPSHVSALMSGVMIKTAIFMLIRFFFDFVPGVALYWGLLLVVFGAISSLLGVLYALTEHDIKRLLAYHSVENIGIILLGVGSAVTFKALGMPVVALLALAAGLYHVINHATFKALLFLGAGSVISKTHTRNIEHYGGLLRVMPYTGLFFLIGAAAISALPPLNGFVSEWLTFQALFAGVVTAGLLVKSVFVFAVIALAFTGGLAAACFVKAFGSTFLARPRSEESAAAQESGPALLIGMGMLAVLCILLGLGSGFVFPQLYTIAQEVLGGAQYGLEPGAASIRMATTGGVPIVAVALLAGVAIIVGVSAYWARRQRVTVSRTWDCGTEPTPRMEITATAFSRSLITMFRGVLRPEKQTAVEYHDESVPYVTKSHTVTVELPNVYMQYLYGPLAWFVLLLGQTFKRIQNGNVNTYVLYIFVTLIVLLVWSVR